ncbi:MAG TPA: type I DNA topoisomerase [Candidatus Paceibacterota bacterium]|nr:type I DNA topoisomerase [Candidatus Pacearchaeota archaeon]HRZ50719.1 type I DNA topoisomerase [Candidatus Paceibacterota bacterium]HSA36384.1 type I DNA topoisomerase [Candidatus Paceibacterota bacterium]
MRLVIVESPTKARTLQGFLGSDYKIISSYGHVRDLPQHAFGVDLEHDFEPKYAIPVKAKKRISDIKKELEKADSVLISTDPDREGEAIAWHLVQALKLKNDSTSKTARQGRGSPKAARPYQRVEFHEITKTAIEEAIKHPRKINESLVNAQQARRILDRIVGYKLSPFLWRKVAKGLSAGRVQSVAVRLVVEREREIEKFVPQDYWEITVLLKNTRLKPFKEFAARLNKIDGTACEKLEIKTQQQADAIVNELAGAEYRVANLEKKETKRNPLPPFTTSTLQQEAWKKFHFQAKFTMQLAQQLYEVGLITYHRTDSLNLSDQAVASAKDYIEKNCGANYWPGQYTRYKTKAKLAQEAHEAIRPTDPASTPEAVKDQKNLNGSQSKLYELIWKRFIACQMSPAVFDSASIDIAAKTAGQSASKYGFRATGQTLKFDGFLKIYDVKFEQVDLPVVGLNELLEFLKLDSTKHQTKPPARYTEATLIKVLEEHGIGRPSTYAPIISTIQTRRYIEKDEKKSFKPTEMGFMVNDILVEHFSQIVDAGFTAKMEEDFDDIAEGKKDWIGVLREFYDPFAKNLADKYQNVEKKGLVQEVTGKVCPKCGALVITRMGRFGKFYACSAFPECKYTETIAQANGEPKIEVKCPKCQTGNIVTKRTKKGKTFYGCSNYPNCDFALWDEPTGVKCPTCGSLMVKPLRGGEKCSNKECSQLDYQKKI